MTSLGARRTWSYHELTAESLISEAWEALVSGDCPDTTFDGATRTDYSVGLRADGTTFLY